MEARLHEDPRAAARIALGSLAELEPVALEATRAAAIACQRWIGRGDGRGADGAATQAMRVALGRTPGVGTIVVGEGAKDEARLAPQRPDEAQAAAQQGLSTEHVYELEELVGGEGLFVATGVTGGRLLRRPWREAGQVFTESLVIAAECARQVVQPGSIESIGWFPARRSAGAGHPSENGAR